MTTVGGYTGANPIITHATMASSYDVGDEACWKSAILHTKTWYSIAIVYTPQDKLE